MGRLVWDSQAPLQTGISNGVLYVNNGVGVPWSGLISINEKSTGGDPESIYVDGLKVLTMTNLEEYGGDLSTYMYPEEFELCDGSRPVAPGIIASSQDKASFSLCYRSENGEDYKIHLIYNLIAIPKEIPHLTIAEKTDVILFSWDLHSLPQDFPGYSRTTKISIDSKNVHPRILSTLENILYGTDQTAPRIPTPAQVLYIAKDVEDLWLTDVGNGIWRAEGNAVTQLPDRIFSITYPTALEDGDQFIVTRD